MMMFSEYWRLYISVYYSKVLLRREILKIFAEKLANHLIEEASKNVLRDHTVATSSKLF
jgi:hypothetical protein